MKGLLLIASAALALGGCTTAQIDRVQTVTERVCLSAPLAIALYEAATAKRDSKAVVELTTFLSISCPSIMAALDAYAATKPAPVAPTPPPPEPMQERG